MAINFTFQQDAYELIKSKIDKISNKFQELDITILDNLKINEAEELINLIKKLENDSENIIKNLNNIQNLKINNNKNILIENELNMKIAPIIMVYRTLLYEKYKNENSHYTTTDINNVE